MLGSLVLAFRESFEAALVVGIILAQLAKIERSDLNKSVYIGAGLGVLLSAIVGVSGFEELGEIFEESPVVAGIMYLVSASLIAYFILWMHKHNNVVTTVKNQIARNTSAVGLFILSFLSVAREGVELITFSLTQISESATAVGLGNLLGILLAVIFAGVIFKVSAKFNLNIIFKVLGAILIFVGGSMLGEGLETLGVNEAISTIAMVLFIVLALVYYFINDIKKITRSTVKAS